MQTVVKPREEILANYQALTGHNPSDKVPLSDACKNVLKIINTPGLLRSFGNCATAATGYLTVLNERPDTQLGLLIHNAPDSGRGHVNAVMRDTTTNEVIMGRYSSITSDTKPTFLQGENHKKILIDRWKDEKPNGGIFTAYRRNSSRIWETAYHPLYTHRDEIDEKIDYRSGALVVGDDAMLALQAILDFHYDPDAARTEVLTRKASITPRIVLPVDA